MKNFILFLRANTSMNPGAFSDPKEIEERKNWLENAQNKGYVNQLGGTMPPIPEMSSTLSADGTKATGPFIKEGHFLTGYLIINAKNMKEAQEIAAANPILKAGGSIEIREIVLR